MCPFLQKIEATKRQIPNCRRTLQNVGEKFLKFVFLKYELSIRYVRKRAVYIYLIWYGNQSLYGKYGSNLKITITQRCIEVLARFNYDLSIILHFQ